MIDLPDQPLAQRILRAALDRPGPPQQLLFFGPPGTGKRRAARSVAWALIDPDRAHDPGDTSLDLTVVAASGASIRLDADLEPALADLAARPSVGKRRVVIIDGAERLREQEGAPRILKQLEEPPPRSHLILVTDHVTDLLPTIRSRCLPVPFRSPGWRHIAAQLEATGIAPDEAASVARAEGAAALTAGPFERSMRGIGVDLAERLLTGAAAGPLLIREIQAQMEVISTRLPSPELDRLRDEAAALVGKRGERGAAKRVEDQEKRERRRALTDGWSHVLDGAAGLVADALAVRVGGESAVRHADRIGAVRDAVATTSPEQLTRTLDAIQLARSDMELNPTLDLFIEGLLAQIASIRAGRPESVPIGRLPW